MVLLLITAITVMFFILCFTLFISYKRLVHRKI